jgi:hypothetical protein
MNISKPVFLVSRAVEVKPEGIQGYYDSDLQLNVVSSNDQTPLIMSGLTAPTHSKTYQRPVDDDPDPGQEKCY